MFKHASDRLPISIILGFSALDFFLYFYLENIWILVAYWLLMIIPKGVISAWNHHHQHSHVFKKKYANRVLEFFYALHTGVTTNLWVLHHNLGHHRHFMDQEADESRWKDRNGKQMGMFRYTLEVALTAYPRGYQVGKKYPHLQRQFVVFGLLTLAAVGLLTYFNPVNALFLFILPMIGSLLYTSWATYGHHAGLDSEDEFASSHNITSKWFNVLTGNLGYHTAHHFKPGVHWSKVPEVHNKIKDKIPAECFRPSFFERVGKYLPIK